MYDNVSTHVDSLTGQLQKALEAEDWPKIQTLDEDIRQRFSLWERSLEQLDAAQSEQLRHSVQELVELYRRAIVACDAYRLRLRGEMQGVQRGRKGVKAYRSI